MMSMKFLFGKKTAAFALALMLFLVSASSVFAAAVFETEPNDSAVTANTMSIGDTALGKSSSASDQDTFVFTTGNNSTINGVFYPTSTSETTNYVLFIYDGNTNTYVVSESIPAGTNKNFSFTGTIGHVYYAIIGGDRASTYYYNMLIYQ
ncbi:hypothetical protein [Paenibacillus cymbidii]|uniref:hypothetical protein n=1 Tax=Paenibacillus cymbidii TaxID=1639034 RepID=UPI00107FE810|nr:hypothetical protein [Paenibacillus cymbidii]